ncbi:MAG TPA: metallophosphoesterase [Gemmatimonadales bacterium]
MPLVALGLAACATNYIPSTPVVPALPEQIAATVFLIGDAGAPAAGGEPVLEALRRELAGRPPATLVLYLGDNVYPLGLPDSADPSFPEAARRLRAQLEVAPDVPMLFVPGNHDWDRSGKDGLARIRRQGRFISRESGGRARLLPRDGCPGPEVAEVSPGLRLILLDTEWWLFPHARPNDRSGCDPGSEAAVTDRLARLLHEASGRQVIVAGHHPLLSGGPHGGYFPLGDHLFPLRKLHPALWIPLPIIGSIYPIARDFGVSPEDLRSGPYRRLRAALDTAFACGPPAVYAAGHEHGLQLLDRGRPPLLAVSGAGIYGHESHVEMIPETRLATAKPGFMRADLLRDGRLRLAVLRVSKQGEPREVYAAMLPRASAAGGGRCSTCPTSPSTSARCR